MEEPGARPRSHSFLPTAKRFSSITYGVPGLGSGLVQLRMVSPDLEFPNSPNSPGIPREWKSRRCPSRSYRMPLHKVRVESMARPNFFINEA